jgi:hypothetical protein
LLDSARKRAPNWKGKALRVNLRHDPIDSAIRFSRR